MKFRCRWLLMPDSIGLDVGATFVRDFISRSAFRLRKPCERDGQA